MSDSNDDDVLSEVFSSIGLNEGEVDVENETGNSPWGAAAVDANDDNEVEAATNDNTPTYFGSKYQPLYIPSERKTNYNAYQAKIKKTKKISTLIEANNPVGEQDRQWYNAYTASVKADYFSMPTVYIGKKSPALTRYNSLNRAIANRKPIAEYKEEWRRQFEQHYLNYNAVKIATYFDDVRPVFEKFKKSKSYRRYAYIASKPTEDLQDHEQKWLSMYITSKSEYNVTQYEEFCVYWDTIEPFPHHFVWADADKKPLKPTILVNNQENPPPGAACKVKRQHMKAVLKASIIRRKREYKFASDAEYEWLKSYENRRENEKAALAHEKDYIYRGITSEGDYELPNVVFATSTEEEVKMYDAESKNSQNASIWARFLQYGLGYCGDGSNSPFPIGFNDQYHYYSILKDAENENELKNWLNTYLANRR